MTTADFNDATWIAGLLALAGKNLGGALIDETAADDFSAAYNAAAGSLGKPRIVSSSMAAEALTGSIDLASTLALGRPVHAPGILETHQVLLIRRAERLDAACASLLAQALDHNQVLLMAVSDLHDQDALLPAKLEERLPFRVDGLAEAAWTPEVIDQAKARMRNQTFDQKLLDELCHVAHAIGIVSPRAVVQAVATARAVAALQGKDQIDDAAFALAAKLVLAHRAQQVPGEDEQQAPPEPPPHESPDQGEAENNPQQSPSESEIILEAVKAALPENLLSGLTDGFGKRAAGRNLKSADQRKQSGKRGRRIGNRRASALAGQRLDILATLRTAAPWQPLRRKLTGSLRMVVTRDDFRVARIKQRNEATAIFAVDASGSTAFQRLAEAKGAVELILAECYVRRDRVALVSFRSKKAEVLLPPTRSLERAKRALAALPGGGGTPLASGLDETFSLALQVRRGGGNPVIIMLTDGRGNVTRAGEGNKAKALEESEASAKMFAAEGLDVMVVDVSPEAQKSAKTLAANMHGTYFAMPRAGASDIALPVRAALKSASA